MENAFMGGRKQRGGVPLTNPCAPSALCIQGHIWNKGFTSGAMTAELFRDVPDALTELRLAGVKTYVYSSGSREAQKLFFGHCQVCRRATQRIFY